MEKNKLSKNSSILVSKTALILWAVMMLLSAAAGYSALAGLFLFFLLLFAFVRYWSARAMDGVSLEISCSKRQLFPGMDTRLEYTVKNDKFLPLPWLELSQLRPENDCVRPDDSYEAYTYLKDSGDKVEHVEAYKRAFSMVMGHESFGIEGVWHAQRRGIYCPKELLLRSGDAFGLSQEEKYYPAELLPELVVYPKKVAVDTALFLRQDWDKNYGSLGFKEDMSVMRGVRPYNSADSWKRINWRMAARQPSELNVNFYETVQPASALFILDGESYCNAPEALEATLEVLASLVDELCSKSVNCGLCLPKSKNFPAVNFSHEARHSASELLYYLAGYDCLKADITDKDGRPTGAFKPSVFELRALSHAAMDAGTVALFTHRPAALSPKITEGIERGRLIVFSSGILDCPDKVLRIMHISALKKEGAG